MYNRKKNYRGGAALFGYSSLNDHEWLEGLEFPIEAYVAFLKDIGLPLPPEWDDEEPAAFEAFSAQEEACINAWEEDDCTASDEVEILDGLTLGDFRRYLESYPPLKHVLPIVVRTLLLAEGNREKTDRALTAKLRQSAKRDRWGTGSGYVLSDAQGEAINKMFLPVGKAGSGNKKTLKVLSRQEYEKEK